MRNDEINDKEVGAVNEFPFEKEEVKVDGKLTREQYKEKYTVAQLAKIAEPMQKRYAFSSLKGKSKDFLIDIILGIKKDEEINVHAPKASHRGTSNESQDIVTMGLGVLQAFKQQREGEQALLNPIAQELFISSAVAKVDEARAEGALKTDKFQTALLALSGTALVIDGVIGFENVPTIFSKLKTKLRGKPQQ